MSEENVEIVREAFEAFNAFIRGERTSESFAERFADPEVEYNWHGERMMPDQPQHLRGAPAILAFYEQLQSAWDNLVLEPLEFIEAPEDRVLVVFRQTFQGRESGVPIEVHAFQLIAIRNGKLRKIEMFRHRAEALEAAGLSE
jgi:ketosteroid isomerase-like protein